MKRIANFWRALTGISLRAKLIIANIVLATIAIVLIGYFSFSVETQSINYLTSQYSQSERTNAENNLNASAESYARDLDEFFAAIEYSMGILGNNMTGVFSQEELIGEGKNWDARGRMILLPSGSWDNANSEAGSIFLPVGKLPHDNYIEINTLKQLDFLVPGMLKNNPDVIAVYFGSVRGETFYYPNVDLANLLPADFDITKRPWYEAAAPDTNPGGKVIWSQPYVDAAANGLVVTSSVPVFDDRTQFRGVAAMDLQLARITDLVSRIRYGDSGYAFVIDNKGHLIAISEKGFPDFNVTQEDIAAGTYLEETLLKSAPLEMYRVLVKMTTFQSGIATIELNGKQKYISYSPIGSVGYSLGLVVDVDETQKNLVSAESQITTKTNRSLMTLAGIMAGIWLVFLLISQRLGTALIAPLTELKNTASRIAEGDLNASITARSTDEVGVLANTLSTMTGNLRSVIAQTEQRVVERTAELQQSTEESLKRAQELKTISEVARAISAETELETLLERITNLVSETFGFYHVGVFLIDEAKGAAVLRATNSPGGRKMLARGHTLKVGQVGIVGYVTGAGQPRIALDVGADAVFFDNPDLPATRSEMALPLKVRNRIIGALDVQSTEVNAFRQEDVETLGILADQVAIAIENARLLEESRQALADLQAAYGESISRAWERKTAKNPIGYYYSATGGRQLYEAVEREESRQVMASGKTHISASEDGTQILAVPIRLREQVIGVVNIRTGESNRLWKEDEIAIVEATVERLALALENARLFEETSGRAAREHAVAEITAKIRQTNDPQVMIQTALEELKRVLNVTRVEIVQQTVSSSAGTPSSGEMENA